MFKLIVKWLKELVGLNKKSEEKLKTKSAIEQIREFENWKRREKKIQEKKEQERKLAFQRREEQKKKRIQEEQEKKLTLQKREEQARIFADQFYKNFTELPLEMQEHIIGLLNRKTLLSLNIASIYLHNISNRVLKNLKPQKSLGETLKSDKITYFHESNNILKNLKSQKLCSETFRSNEITCFYEDDDNFFKKKDSEIFPIERLVYIDDKIGWIPQWTYY